MARHFGRMVLTVGLVCAALGGFRSAGAGEPAGASAPETSVVDIVSAEGHGTGILLNKSGRILTNAHFAASPLPLECRADVLVGDKIENATFKRVTVVGFHPSLDLALLQIDPRESKGQLLPAKLSRQSVAEHQSVQLVLDPPTGGPDPGKTQSNAAASDLVRAADGNSYLSLTGPMLNAGNAGTSVCDDAGRVLGILMITPSDGHTVGVLVPMGELNDPGKFVAFDKRKARAETAKVLIASSDEHVEWARKASSTRGDADPETLIHLHVAAACCRQAVVEDPTDAGNFYRVANILRTVGKNDAAAPYLMLAIDRDPWPGTSDSYRELGVALQSNQSKQDQARVVWDEGLAKFPRQGAKMWEDLAVVAADKQQDYDAAYDAAVGLRVANERTRKDVLQSIHDNCSGRLSDGDRRKLDQAEGQIDQMLRDREEASDRAHKANKRFINRACEDLIARGTRGIFQHGTARMAAADSASNSLAAAPAEPSTKAAGAGNAAEGNADAVARPAVPSSEKQAEAVKNVEEVYSDDLAAAHTMDEKKTLAKKLMKTARETDNDKDIAARFVLLRMARDLAIQAGDATTAFEAIDELSGAFEVDGMELQTTAIIKLAATARTKDQHALLAAKGLAAVARGAGSR